MQRRVENKTFGGDAIFYVNSVLWKKKSPKKILKKTLLGFRWISEVHDMSLTSSSSNRVSFRRLVGGRPLGFQVRMRMVMEI